MRVALLVVATGLALASPATAAERGVVIGRAVNQTTGAPARGVTVILSGADEDGSSRVRRSATTSNDGRYRFDDLPAGRDWLFVLDARFDDGLFPGHPFTFARGEKPILDTSLKVWNTTTDPRSVVLERDSMFVLPADDGVAVIESVRVVNQTQLAYVGRDAAGEDDGSTFGFALPSGASDVAIQDASLDVPQLVETDFGFGITVAIPPGRSDFTYAYRVPPDGSMYVLSKTALYPTADLVVFAGEPLELESDRLRESGTETLEGETYRRFVAPGFIEAGDTILIQAVAQADIQWIPFAAGGAALFTGISAAYLFARRRSGIKAAEAPPTRDELIAAIAALDIAYENGSVEPDRWESDRAELKTRLLELERQ